MTRSGPTRRLALVVAFGVTLSFAVAARGTTSQIALFAAVVAGAGIITLASRNVRTALVVLLVFVPLQQVVLAYLYAHGLPAGLAKNLGYLKEMISLGVVLAALRTDVPGWQWRAADTWGLAFLGVALFYAAVPLAAPNVLGSADLAAIVSSLRLNCLFVVLFLACRRLSWTRRDAQVLGTAVAVATVFLAVGALWERFFNSSFVTFANSTLQIQQYKAQVLRAPNIPASFVSGLSEVGSSLTFRVGSFLFDFLSLGFYLILPLSLGVCLLARRRFSLVALGIVVLAAASLAVNLSRSSILGGAVAAALIVGALSRLRLPTRNRVVVLALLGAVLVLPLISGSAVAVRIQGAFNGTDNSTGQHTSRSAEGFQLLLHHPLGSGIGSNFVTATREATGTSTLSENGYLQIGNELGLLAMVLFIGFTIATQSELWRAAGREGTAGTAMAAWAAGWGLAVNSLLLQVWVSIPTALAFWAIAGVASVSSGAVGPKAAQRAQLHTSS